MKSGGFSMKLTGLNILVFLEDEHHRGEMAYMLKHFGANTFVAANLLDLKTIYSLWDIDLWLVDDHTHFNLSENFEVEGVAPSRIVLTKKKNLNIKRPEIRYLRQPFSPTQLVQVIHQKFWEIEDMIPIFKENQDELKLTLFVDKNEIDVTHGEIKTQGLIVNLPDVSFTAELGLLDILIPNNKKSIREQFMVKFKKSHQDLWELIINEKDKYRWDEIIKLFYQDQEMLNELLIKIKGT
jgi:hypothetical protein